MRSGNGLANMPAFYRRRLSGCIVNNPTVRTVADERLKLSDSVHAGARLKREGDGRIRCADWFASLYRPKNFAKHPLAGGFAYPNILS